MTRIEASVCSYMYRWNLMVLLSSLSSRDCARKFRQVLPQWSNRPITIFHPRDGKSPLARLALAPWRPSRSDLRPTRSTVWKAAQKAPRGGVFLCNSFASYGSIFQVPPVSDYSTWCSNAYLRVRCTSLLFTRLVHQPLFTRWCTNHLLTRH